MAIIALFLLRHCKSANNSNKLFTGQMDIEISDNFYDVSCLPKNSLNKLFVYISPLKRCQQTYELISKQLPENQTLLVSPLLVERSYGVFEGEEKQKMNVQYPAYFQNSKFLIEKTPPHGESFEQFQKRVLSFYVSKRIRQYSLDYSVIILAHQNILKSIYCIHTETEPFPFWNDYLFSNGVLVDIAGVKIDAER